ncbi:MAG: hypothetical protein ACRBBK_07560 [Paracoccaceae bacterium]
MNNRRPRAALIECPKKRTAALKTAPLLFLSAALLAACDLGPRTGPIVSKTIGPDTIVLGETIAETTINGVEQTDLVLDPLFDYGLFKGWHDTSAPVSFRRAKTGYIGESTSGGSFAFVGGFKDLSSPHGSAIYGRTVETKIPDKGKATYTGQYAATAREFVGDPSNSTIVDGLITGDTSLTVDFETSAVSGSITNRLNKQPSGNSTSVHQIADLIFEPTTFNRKGEFSGSTAGGEYILDDSGVSGTFGGLISGSHGQETVGRVNVLHDYRERNNPETTYIIETGVFIAE